MEAFFSNEFADIFNAIAIANSTLPSGESWNQVDGSYHLSKADLAAVLGIGWYGIDVANRSVADGYNDYAERTFIWGGTQAKLSDSEDLVFVVDPYSGERYIKNLAIVPLGNENFDFDGSDFVTNSGNFVLRHAVDPSGLGVRVDLKFEEGYDPPGVMYTLANYQADLDKEASWSQPSFGDLLAAIQVVVDDLWANGVTRFLQGDKPIIYGTESDDVIASSYTILDYDIAASSTDLGLLDLKLHEFVGNGIIYQGGSGNDYVTGTSGEDVAYGGDGNDMLDGFEGDDIVIGGAGADSLFGGGADDFIFFDFADGGNVYGGAGRDVAVALGEDGVTVDMAAQGLECVIGCDGADTITIAGGTEPLFAAGGGGVDTFNVTYDWQEGPKILWGGGGADSFDFTRTETSNPWDEYQIGIAVVKIDGLTEAMFASLTLADLGIGNMDMSKVDVIIINPDADDRFSWYGSTIDTSEIYPAAYNFLGYENGTSFEVRSSGYLGDTYAIQGVYNNRVEVENEKSYGHDFEYYAISITPDSVEVIPAEWSEGMFWSSWDQDYAVISPSHPQIAASIARLQAEAADYFATIPDSHVVQEASDVPYETFPFFVVGGQFDGNTLLSNDALFGSLPDDPGPSPFDWLLVA